MHSKRRQNNMNGNGGNGQHRHHNNRPRRFNNNRPQGGEGGGNDPASIMRTRRNAVQNREKYQMMARDAQAQGDRVLAENWLQHADHYHRILLSLPPEEAPRPQYINRHQQNGEQPQQGQEGQEQGGHQAHSDNNGHGHSNGGGNHAPQQEPHDNGLPSFITQSSHTGGPEE